MKQLKKIDNCISLVDSTNPAYENDKVTIMVVYVGLCRTDLYVANNKIKTNDIILGHEFSGIVIYDPTNTFKILDSVTVNPLQNNKFMGLDFDGCLQTYINVDPKYVHKHNLPNLYAAYSEPFSASLSVIDYIEFNKKIGVYGNNRIASLTFSILLELGYDVELVDFTKKEYFDYVIETEVNTNNFENLISTIKDKGNLIIKSRNTELLSIDIVKCIKKSLQIKFSNYYDFNKTLQHMEKLSHIITPLIGKIYPIEKWNDAFTDANNNSSKKVFISL